MNLNSKIYVAGHRGLVGSAIIKELKKKGFKKIIIANRRQLDLTNQKKDIFELKPNIGGFGINFNEINRRLSEKFNI